MNSKWPICKLSQIAEVASGQGAPQASDDFGKDGNPFVRAGSLDSLVKGASEDNCEHVSADVAKRYRLRLFPQGTVLFAKSGMSATLGRIYQLRKPAYVVNHLAALIPTKSCVPSYLKYWLQVNSPSRLIQDTSYPSIRLSDISDVKIPCPPLDEQRRIAAILDKADAIRQKRQESLHLTEEFLRSVFLDMFGDPVTNPKGWPVERLRTSLIDARNGMSRRGSIGEDGGNIVLRLQDIRENKITFDKPNRIYLTDFEKDKYQLEKGDIAFIRVNGNKNYVGRCAVFEGHNEEIYFNDHIIRLRFYSSYNPYFLTYFFNEGFGKYMFAKQVKTSAGQYTISQEGIEQIDLVKPPIELQNEYLSVLRRNQTVNDGLWKSTAEITNLVSSLTQRAFRGEL